MPRNVEGALLAIADKVDSIGGNVPPRAGAYGSKDPFGCGGRQRNRQDSWAGHSVVPLGLGGVARAAAGADESWCGRWRCSSRSGWSSICERQGPGV